MGIADLITDRYRDYLVSAAAEPDAWAGALHDVCGKTGSTGAILFHRSAMPGTPVSRGAAEGMETYWRENWVARDIRLRAIPTQMSIGLGTDEDCVTADEMRRAPLYADFLARFGLRWFAGVGFQVAGQMWCMSIQRSPAQGMFEADEKRVLKQMSRIMAEVGELSHLVAEAKTVGLTAALDQFGDYWATYDLLGRRIAHASVARGPSGGSATYLDLVKREPLASHVADALAAVRKGSFPARGCVQRTVTVDGAVLGLRAIRLTDIHAGFGRAQYLVVLRENLPPEPMGATVLRSRYRLTAAEVQLAQSLVDGLSVRAAADARQVAYETARAQLKSIFGKLGVHRQSELLALLRSGVDGKAGPSS